MTTPSPPTRPLRRRLALSFVGLAMLLGACGGGGGDPGGSAPPWVVLGSSTAAGVGAGPGLGWAALLSATARSKDSALVNRARSGAVTYHALPASTARPAGRPATDPGQDVAVVLRSAPRLLVLAFPSNDALLGYGADETVANLLLLRSLAAAAGVPTLLLSSQPRDDASSTQRATMRATDAALAPVFGACFVDVRDALSAPSGGIAAAFAAGDGVHLNDAGHRLIFDRLSATLASGACVRL